MEHKPSELTVITKAKDLCSYVMTITQKSPKQFRFTFISRMQNLSLDVIKALYRANDTFVTKESISAREKRLEFQHQAMTDLKLLAYSSYHAHLSHGHTYNLQKRVLGILMLTKGKNEA